MENLRRIIIIFVIIVFVCLTGIGIYLGFNGQEETVENQPVSLPTLEVYEEDEESGEEEESEAVDKIKLFVIKGDDCENTFFISVPNSKDDKLTFVFFPAETKVSLVKSETEAECLTLSEVYERGIDELLDVISGNLSIVIKEYAILSASDFATFVNYFTSRDNGVEFSLPVEISTTENGSKITFAKGKDYYNGINAKRLITFYKTDDDTYGPDIIDYYDGTDICRVNTTACFISEFAQQKLTAEISEYYSDNYAYFLKCFIAADGQTDVVTNIPESDAETIALNMQKIKAENVISYVYQFDTETIYSIESGADRYITNECDASAKTALLLYIKERGFNG